MPFRNIPEWISHAPEWLQWALGFMMMLASAGIGAMAKIADDIKSGERERFWSKKLFLDLPALAMMTLISIAITEYYGLPSPVGIGIGSFLGWAGPRVLDTVVLARITNGRGK